MQCSRSLCTKALYSRKMTPSVSFSISFLMVSNILSALFAATEHRADSFRKLTDHFSELRLSVPSSASHRQGLDYFCYMCCLTFIYTIAHVTIFCSHISFSEILCYFLPLIWHLTTWNALIICKSLFIKILNKNRFKTDPPVTQPLIFPYYNIWSLGIFFTFFKEFSIYVKEIHLLQSK